MNDADYMEPVDEQIGECIRKHLEDAGFRHDDDYDADEFLIKYLDYDETNEYGLDDVTSDEVLESLVHGVNGAYPFPGLSPLEIIASRFDDDVASRIEDSFEKWVVADGLDDAIEWLNDDPDAFDIIDGDYIQGIVRCVPDDNAVLDWAFSKGYSYEEIVEKR